MSTSDKVAAGVFSAAAVGIALLSSSSCWTRIKFRLLSDKDWTPVT
jgi:hypothetical protein